MICDSDGALELGGGGCCAVPELLGDIGILAAPSCAILGGGDDSSMFNDEHHQKLQQLLLNSSLRRAQLDGLLSPPAEPPGQIA